MCGSTEDVEPGWIEGFSRSTSTLLFESLRAWLRARLRCLCPVRTPLLLDLLPLSRTFFTSSTPRFLHAFRMTSEPFVPPLRFTPIHVFDAISVPLRTKPHDSLQPPPHPSDSGDTAPFCLNYGDRMLGKGRISPLTGGVSVSYCGDTEADQRRPFHPAAGHCLACRHH